MKPNLKNSNGNDATTRRTKSGIIRTMIHSKRGRTASGTVIAIKFLIYFIAATVVSMPFVISFMSTISDYEASTLERFLESSKMTLSPPPFFDGKKDTAIQYENLWFKHSLENPPENSPYTILHTVTTRFMVGQAQNITLNKQHEIQQARYMLFETFCWPTVQRQTSMNFYWLVLVDPNLDRDILDKVKSLLSNETHFPAQNAFMVLTNNTKWSSDGVGVENSTSYAVGLQPVAQEFQDGALEVVTGNTDYLLRALDVMKGNDKTPSLRSGTQKPLMVIETLLDADDGLNNGAVEWIQGTASQRTKEHWEKLKAQEQQNQTTALRQSTQPPSLNTTWWFLCGTDHIEWHNRQIFQLTDEEYKEEGITSGLAGLRQKPLFCTSAGFTRIGITHIPKTPASNYSHMFFPKDGYSNHALTFYFPECTPSNNTSSVIASGNYSGCWHREFAEKAYIVKSRTITSDSMDHLNVAKTKDYRDISWLNASDFPLLINNTEHMWDILDNEFSIQRTKAWELSVYVFEHRHAIIKQNKQSRCSPGFPCFKTAKRNLIRMERYWAKQRVKQRKAKKQEEEVARRANTTNVTTSKGSDDNSKQSNAGLELAAALKEALEEVDRTNTTEMMFLRQRIAKNLGSNTVDRHVPRMDTYKRKPHSKTNSRHDLSNKN